MTLSLATLDDRVDTPVETEMLDPEGNPTGIILHVLGAHTDTVVAKVNDMLNAQRRKRALREAKAIGRRGEPDFDKVEDDQEFTRKAAAIRVAGWNLKEDATEANVSQLFRLRPEYILQVLDASSDMGRFTKPSPKAS